MFFLKRDLEMSSEQISSEVLLQWQDLFARFYNWFHQYSFELMAQITDDDDDDDVSNNLVQKRFLNQKVDLWCVKLT